MSGIAATVSSKKREPKGGRGRRLTLPGNPEIPKRSSIEVLNRLYLKNDPDIVDALERLIQENGYKTVPEAVRHLLYVAISATPWDGEFRAAMSSVRSQMIQYFTTRYWSMLKELLADFEKDFSQMNPTGYIDAMLQKQAEERANAKGQP